MSVAEVESAVQGVMRTAREHGPWLAGNQLAVRYALVDPVLHALGWNTWSPSQCLPNFDLGHRGRADYALFDPHGRIAVLALVGTMPARRRAGRVRLMAQVRGMSSGIAVLTYGTVWEIYDLRLRGRSFADKLVESLYLDLYAPNEAALALHQWLSQDLWWDGAP